MNVFRPKFAAAGLPKKCETRNLRVFFLALFLLLVGSGPKRSTPIEKLGSSLLVSSTALQFNRTATLKPGKKKCPCHLIYVWACVNKDFVHRTNIGQARALCSNHNYNKIVKSDWLSTALISAVDKTRNMEHPGTFRNIPEHPGT